MPNRFLGATQTAFATFARPFQGPSTSVEQIKRAQKTRATTFYDLMGGDHYSGEDIAARSQYWSTHLYFLIRLLKGIGAPMAADDQIDVSNKEKLAETLGTLIDTLNDEQCLKAFIGQIRQDSQQSKSSLPGLSSSEGKKEDTASSPLITPNIQQGDILTFINDAIARGRKVIVDNAPNAFRDGASKYAKGSLEELLARYTDAGWKMVLHFSDVHQRNQKNNQSSLKNIEPVDVLDYQKRYLQMMLTICKGFVNRGDDYLRSGDFYADLFDSFKNEKTGVPIYFDLQSNAFEVSPQTPDVSYVWYQNGLEKKCVEDIVTCANNPQVKPAPMITVGYAAPDKRRLKTTPLDVACTSNTVWQNPWAEGQMGSLLAYGIAKQCEDAVEHAQTQPVSLYFVMPGCGAFNNPKESTVAEFYSTVYYYTEQYKINKNPNIEWCIVEYDKPLFDLIVKTANDQYNGELGALNHAIHAVVSNRLLDDNNKAIIQKKAVAIKACIMDLISQKPRHIKALKDLLGKTADVLQPKDTESLDAYKERIRDYQAAAYQLQKDAASLGHSDLGRLMGGLGVALMTVAAILVVIGGVPSLPCAVAGGVGLLLLGGGLGLFSHANAPFIELKKHCNELAEAVSPLEQPSALPLG